MSVVRPKNQISLIGCGMMKRFRLAALSALMILLAASLFLGAVEFAVAQDIFGRIAGTVTDSSGGTVPDVKVTIVNEATQVSRDVTTDQNGYFVAENCQLAHIAWWQRRPALKGSQKKATF